MPSLMSIMTVHPRVGGELPLHAVPDVDNDGSSPRGRGTPCRCWPRRALARFIPAWAGNSAVDVPVLGFPPVHPRVGGELIPTLWTIPTADGSSPRGRGTQIGIEAATLVARFIPAWAGNSTIRPYDGRGEPVHPRVGGELVDGGSYQQSGDGSFPRGR